MDVVVDATMLDQEQEWISKILEENNCNSNIIVLNKQDKLKYVSKSVRNILELSEINLYSNVLVINEEKNNTYFTILNRHGIILSFYISENNHQTMELINQYFHKSIDLICLIGDLYYKYDPVKKATQDKI